MNATLEKFNSFDILLICGVYGSGKNAFAEKYFKNGSWNRVSRNEIRKLLYEMTRFGDAWESAKFSEEDDILVKHIERKILEHYLHNKRKVLVINTFATKKSRQRFVSLAAEYKKTIGAVFMNMPLEFCLSGYKKHNPTMPENVLRSMFQKIELPEKREGFTEVLEVHPKE
ncbi:MAG TPA: ATP-binding protein [Spirochaetota bacterium]|nr:ATP-binding protein [Spirochaetota bacterium]HQE60415.1 ATP-binding protein [Spirochaetota bacterium]